MSKAPWFPFYAGDFLASPDVQLMEAHEVGAYLLLLLHSWQSDTPGYLADDEGRMRRAARLNAVQWADSRAVLLGKWPLAEDGRRHNPRLVAEAGKQVERRERLAANGQKGGRPVKQKDSKTKPTENLELSLENQKVIKSKASGLLSYSQSQSTDVDESASPPLASNPARAQALATTDQADEQPWHESPLAKPTAFRAICEDNGFLDIDFEHYRRQALDAARNETPARPRTAPQWRSWVRKYLNHEKRNGPLLRPGDVQRAAADPEADRLRHATASAPPLTVAANYVPYVSKPNQPGQTAEPQPAYGPLTAH